MFQVAEGAYRFTLVEDSYHTSLYYVCVLLGTRYTF